MVGLLARRRRSRLIRKVEGVVGGGELEGFGEEVRGGEGPAELVGADGVVDEGFGISESSRLLSGVEINHCVKRKVIGGIVEWQRVLGREPVFKKVKSWLRGERSVEKTVERSVSERRWVAER